MKNIFKDSQDNIIIAQWPNTPLWLAILFALLKNIQNPTISSISSWGLIISLLYWSYLEITDGANNWRRFLGIVVGFSQLIQLFRLFF